jgi:ribosomal subunit interface protein
MRLQVQGNEQALAQAMRSYIERRLRLTLGRYVTGLAQVTVRVADAGAPAGCPRGGCRIRVELLSSGRLLQHEVDDACLFSAVDTAVERMARAVRREVGQSEARPR